MPGLVAAGEDKAKKVRTIVESKENFVWATQMTGPCDIFEIDHLGRNIAAEMTELLSEQGLLCYPSPLPSQQGKSVIIMLAHSEFARGFSPADTNA